MKTKEDKLKLLDETIAHFSVNPRSMVNNKCMYYADEKRGCAIGRLIEDKELCRKLDAMEETVVRSEAVFEALPTDLQEYGMEYLNELQKIHDAGYLWDENGLSVAGKIRYEEFKKEIETELV